MRAIRQMKLVVGGAAILILIWSVPAHAAEGAASITALEERAAAIDLALYLHGIEGTSNNPSNRELLSEMAELTSRLETARQNVINGGPEGRFERGLVRALAEVSANMNENGVADARLDDLLNGGWDEESDSDDSDSDDYDGSRGLFKGITGPEAGKSGVEPFGLKVVQMIRDGLIGKDLAQAVVQSKTQFSRQLGPANSGRGKGKPENPGSQGQGKGKGNG